LVSYCVRVLLQKIRHPRRSVFRSIYLGDMWGSGSGGGSTLEQTEAVRDQLPKVAEELRVRSVLDAPCGDYRWMSQVDWDLESYVGVDIVPELIERNRAQYAREGVQFVVADITRHRLPRADLVLVRDCFVHMSLGEIAQALRTLKASGSTYLLTTIYPGAVKRNRNIMSGWWRALDFERPPFNFPAPARVIDEETTDAFDRREKSLGLWRFEDLPLG
jgi:SAM-dependent methyltransferase